MPTTRASRPSAGVSATCSDATARSSPGAARLSAEADLGYRRDLALPRPGAGLAFDERYRFAHLPLIAPRHPLVIPATPDGFYRMGRHPSVTSLVMMVDDAALAASPAFVALQRAIAAAPFGPKVAWSLAERRRGRLHATVAGSLTEAEVAAVSTPTRRTDPVAVELRGLFVGPINRGRIYLRVYPDERQGEHGFASLQRRLGRAPTDLFLVGLHNLVAELTPGEAAALRGMVEAWWDRPLLRFCVDALTLLRSRDDLVLDAEIADEVQPVR